MRTRSRQLIDDVDEYTGHGVFWVPAERPLGVPGAEREGHAGIAGVEPAEPSAS